MTAKSINLAMLLVAGLATCIRGECAESSSSPTAVWVKPEESLQWKAIMSASAPVALCWPDGAETAHLTVSWNGSTLGSATTSDTTAATIPLPIDTFPSVLDDERMVEVMVEYVDGSDEVLDSETVSLGYVTGIGSNPTRLVADTTAKQWGCVGKLAVLPIPEDTTALTIDSVEQEIGTPPGWWEWFKVASGSHELELSTESGDFVVGLLSSGSGLMLIAR